MILRQYLVSYYVAVVFIITAQVCSCKDIGDENSVDDHYDAIIRKLLDPGQESADVSWIFKSPQANKKAKPKTSPRPTFFTATTPKPMTTTSSPFFNTERPSVAFLDRLIQETQQELGNGKSADRKSDYYHHHHGHHRDPPLNKLLWGTAQAVWDVSRPVFYKTTFGRTVGLAADTFTLPLRTVGAVRKRIKELTNYPYGYHGSHKDVLHLHDDHHHGLGWDHHGDHHHGHGHGWDSKVVYVKYEPENSLLKSWLRYMYRAARPAVVTKIRLHRLLARMQLHFLYGLIKHIDIHKVAHLIRRMRERMRRFRHRLRKHIQIFRGKGKGWGWSHDHHDHQYKYHDHHHHAYHYKHHDHHDHHYKDHDHHVHELVLDGWKPGPPPNIADHLTILGYESPKQESPAPVSYKDTAYGAPAKSSYDKYEALKAQKAPTLSYGTPDEGYGTPAPTYGTPTQTYGPPSQSYGAPSQGYGAPSQGYETPTQPPPMNLKSAIAYSQDNSYANFPASPGPWLTAPKRSIAKPSESEQESSPSADIESPSYAAYLKQLGINPTNLAALSSADTDTATSNLKELVRRAVILNSEDVPYLISDE